MGSWLGDVRYAFRQLARAPGFAAAAVAVLALGIGLNAGMFSLVYAIGFAGRAYADPDRVVQLYSSRTSDPDSYRAFSFPAYQQLASSDGFSGVLAHSPALVGVSEGGESRRTFGCLVSRNYFDVLGVPVAIGRGFTEEESRPGQDLPVVVATHGFWQRHGLDPPWSAPRCASTSGRSPSSASPRAVSPARCASSGRSCSSHSASSTPSPTTSTAPRPAASSAPTPTACSWSPGSRRATLAAGRAGPARRPRPRR